MTSLAAGAMALVLASSTHALALNPALDVSQYAHTAWRVSEGFFKGSLIAIAQTRDGYLWLGTDNGLFRFDGIKSVAWQPPPGESLPSNRINNLLVARDGVLWIGTEGGLASWNNGRLTRYPALTGRAIGRMIEDHEGSVWLPAFRPSSGSALCLVVKGVVDCDSENGGPGAGAISVYEDRGGNVWAGTRTGLWRMRPSPARFYPLQSESAIAGLSEDDKGGLLYADRGVIRRFIDGRSEATYVLPPSMQTLVPHAVFRDRDGGLWFAASGGGLVHVHQGITDGFAKSDGLSADTVSSLFEDREGTMWAATAGGLDRFREAAVAPISAEQGLSSSRVYSVLAAKDGSVWSGTADALNKWSDGSVTVYRQPPVSAPGGKRDSRAVRYSPIDGWAAGAVGAIFEDSAGRVWMSTPSGVGFIDKGRLVRVRGLPEGTTRAIGEDRRGNLWIANQTLGLFYLSRDATIIEHIQWTELNHNDPASAMAVETAGGVWLGFAEGGIALLRDRRIQASFAAAQGLAQGRVRNLLLDSTGSLWVATDGGLSRVKDNRVATLTAQNGMPCDSSQWVIEDDSRTLWVGTTCGLARIARDDIDAWWSNVTTGATAAYMVRPTVFGSTDGFRIPSAISYTAAVVKSEDGRLWFQHEDGIGVLDPRRLPFNQLPPPVVVEQITANDTGYAVHAAGVRLSALIRELQIDYNALSLVAPEKMQFRYKLEGWDRDWQDVGTRRQAFYANLPPRSYRFRVIASNNSGVWNDTGATLDFTIAPAYYQTTWFPALVVGVVIAGVWGAHRLRLRIVEKHEREISALNERLMKAQEQERIRIAGELHDGVMQQLLAVTMMLGTTKRRASDSDTKTSLDKIQEKLIQAGTDIRQLSHDLHPPVLQEAGLPEAMRNYCEEFSASSGIAVACDADDRIRDLSRGSALALFRIVQEALGNAAKHAHAKRITVRLTRSAKDVSLVVSDDGAGFDPGQLGTKGLGLVMMRERASQLNGTFEFDSAPGRGTTIRIVIPFR